MKYLIFATCFVLMDVIFPREEKDSGCACRGSYPDPDPAVRPEVIVEDDVVAEDAATLEMDAETTNR